MGVGKSSVGELLAARLGLRFVDMDLLLERAHGPISEQFRQDGEAVFRQREREVVQRLCENKEHIVVATGGGVWADPESRERLKSAFSTVVLSAPFAVCMSRCESNSVRPLLSDAKRLWDERREAYTDADHVVAATGSVDEVVDRVVACVDPLWSGRVNISDSPYPVHVAHSWAQLGSTLRWVHPERRHAVLISEPRVYGHWGASVEEALKANGWRCDTLVQEVSESAKTMDTWSHMLDELLALNPDRDTVVFALGGGVLGDVAGFAAATALRGLSWVQLPTTLLAMADSAVGGKTGVNHGGVKNRVGAFHQPSLVYASLQTLGTLPSVEFVNGMAEVVKTAAIGDRELFERLETCGAGAWPGALAREAVCASLRYKAAVVSFDPREAGMRGLLNAGHTVGHALERAMSPGGLRHGEAVAIGLVAEARWAERAGLCEEPDVADRIAGTLAGVGLPTKMPQIAAEALVEAMRLDKKARGDTLRLPVPRRVGHYEIVDICLSDLPSLVTI
jgi:3-dehydroquinate synthase